MANYTVFILTLILFKKLFGTAESNLVQVFVHFFARHTNSLINYADGFLFGIEYHLNFGFAYFTIKFTNPRKGS